MATTYEDILNFPLSSWDASLMEQIDDYLIYIDDVDVAYESYSFDLVRFYVRRSDGQILYAYDSGCSCPSPFDTTRVRELQETTLDGVEAAVLEHWSEARSSSAPRAEMQSIIRSLKKAIKETGGK